MHCTLTNLSSQMQAGDFGFIVTLHQFRRGASSFTMADAVLSSLSSSSQKDAQIGAHHC